MKIGNKHIGDGNSVFIVAEMSANHNGSLETALETIRAAKRAGADAIKLQTYTADTITLDSKNEEFKINKGTIWDGRTLYDLYEEAHTPWAWHQELFEVARQEGLEFFSSPFDPTSVDFLESLNVSAYKIASFEITDIPLIEKAALKGKPMIISTGIADSSDIQMAIDACKKSGNEEIILLKCTSSYPAPIEQANLQMIPDIAARFGVFSGLSDHTMGWISPVVAVTMGAVFIEKHFILNKSIGGPDASFSLDESEFKEMVKAVRDAEKSIGKIDYELSQKQKNSRYYCRSLYVAENVNKGDKVTISNVRSIRPGLGLHPKHLDEILGSEFSTDVKKGEPFSFDLIG